MVTSVNGSDYSTPVVETSFSSPNTRRDGIRHEANNRAVVRDPWSPKRVLLYGLAAFAAVAGAVAPVNGRGPLVRHALPPGPDKLREQAAHEPRYEGHLLQGITESFYLPNSHRFIGGVPQNVTQFVHPHYFDAPNTKALGREIVAHRGLWDLNKGIPGNSIAAVQQAYDNGLRSVELDVRVTKDGHPILMHDQSLGRIAGDPANRLVSHVEWDEIKGTNLVIRNPVDGNFIETDQKVTKLEDALLDILQSKPDMSVALDCKDRTGEAVLDLLLERPELRRFTAIKIYAKAYPGGFDQFLGNLYERHGIDPQDEGDRLARQELLETLRHIKVEPVFSEVVLENEDLLKLFPSQVPEGPHSAQGLAESAMAWLQSWSAMDIKVIEAHPTGAQTPKGLAMILLSDRLKESSYGLSGVATLASYRYEDFSALQLDGSRKYYTWGDCGEIYDKTDDPIHIQRETAGSLRFDGENVLTDQPQEEVFATLNNRTLDRGHSGVELRLEPGTVIDTSRNMENVATRKRESEAERQKVDPDYITEVRAGRRADADHQLVSAPDAGLGNLAVLAAAATTVGIGGLLYVKSRNVRGAVGTVLMAGSSVVQDGVGALQSAVNALQLRRAAYFGQQVRDIELEEFGNMV
jgi:glycerophosphoryl diester phosphodiesterase